MEKVQASLALIETIKLELTLTELNDEVKLCKKLKKWKKKLTLRREKRMRA